MAHGIRCAALFIASMTIVAAPSSAQCREWAGGYRAPGLDRDVNALIAFDDGSGPALYAGGVFHAAGGAAIHKLAKWDGSNWSGLGFPAWFDFDGVYAFAVFDDGSGPALFAGGEFFVDGPGATNIAKWDGSAWSALSSGVSGGPQAGPGVMALAVYDDGSGPALYAGGLFTTAGGASAANIARWDGSTWSPLGSGTNGAVRALTVFDDGTGPALYAGGDFNIASSGGGLAHRIARWNGSSWSSLGSGASSSVRALTVFDDGTGSALYAGGDFTTAGGASALRIAKWNGSSWSAVASGFNAGVSALTALDDGAGAALYAGGDFWMTDSLLVPGAAKWNGSEWSAMSSGMDSPVRAFAAFDDGDGAKLFAGGQFIAADGHFVDHLARWDGAQWGGVPQERGVPKSFESVLALCAFDDGTGEKLYLGAGDGNTSNQLSPHYVARLDGELWSPVGSGLNNDVSALTVFDDGSGPALFACGYFKHLGGPNSLAKWDGSNWLALPSSCELGPFSNPLGQSLTVFDDGSGAALYAGGRFVKKWDGNDCATLGGQFNAPIYALQGFDDGSGPTLYAGGHFTNYGAALLHYLARWDGTTWTEHPSPLNQEVRALAVFDDGSGPALYAGGLFTTAGGASVGHIAKWDGATWSALGSGVTSPVRAMTVFDDGSGSALYVACGTDLGGPNDCITKWDGVAWSAVGASTIRRPRALAIFDDGSDGAADLYVGCEYNDTGGVISSGVARWNGCEAGTPYCFGDGVDPIVTAQCPCGNFGDAGHGCANSNASLGGARLWASGATSPNTLVLHCEGIPNNALGTFMRGTMNTAAGLVMGDGVQCATGTIIRFGQQPAGQNGNPSNTIAVGAATVAPGLTRYYQVQYRNPNAGFCPPEIFNFSNGYVVTW